MSIGLIATIIGIASTGGATIYLGQFVDELSPVKSMIDVVEVAEELSPGSKQMFEEHFESGKQLIKCMSDFPIDMYGNIELCPNK